MLILIDGYNLLFGTSPAAEILKDERESLIQSLAKWLDLAKLEATIVFDSYIPDTPETRGHLGPLEVVFTNKGELADESIMKRIKASTKPQQILLVTNDKRLAARAKRALAKVITIHEWMRDLQKIAAKKKDPQPKTLPKASVKRVPEIKQEPEHDIAFYLEVFEKLVGDEEVPKKKKKPFVSEEERWLRLFEKRLQK